MKQTKKAAKKKPVKKAEKKPIVPVKPKKDLTYDKTAYPGEIIGDENGVPMQKPEESDYSNE